MNPRKRLGEMLLEAGIIDETQLRAALGHQRQWGVRIGQALVDLKLATEADIVRALAGKYGFEVALLGGLQPRALEPALKLLTREFAVRNNLLPISADTGSLTVAMSDPTNLAVVDEIGFRTGRRVKVCIGGDREITEAVSRFYPAAGAVEAIALDLDLDADDSGAEALHDPFGGGSKDALEAFFRKSGPDASPAPAATAGRASIAPAAPVGAGPAARPGPRWPAPSSPAVWNAPAAAPPPLASAAAPAPRAPPAVPVQRATPLPSPEAARTTAVIPIPPSFRDRTAAPDGGQSGALPDAQPLTVSELSVLEALDRLADGAHPEPEIVKPAQAMAALIRLLLRKRIVTDRELLDELSKK